MSISTQVMKGRGAISNPNNRFHQNVIVRDSDSLAELGVDYESESFSSGKKLETEVQEVLAKSVISKNKSPDLPFEQSVNPYAGCEHGCVYCYARPTHAYHDMSAGLDFETKLVCKTNVVEVLREELSKPGYQCKPIVLGSNTDPYQPLEAKRALTRGILELLYEVKHPVSIITKGSLIERDLDILSDMAKQGLCSVNVSMTTLDNELKRTLEPRAADARTRLKLISALNTSGVPTGVLVAPVIPAINDSELESILYESAQAGAYSARYILLRLPHEVKTLFVEWLHAHFPQRARHVLSLIEQSRNGKLYNANFNQRMTGTGVFSELIAQRFYMACRKNHLNSQTKEHLNCNDFSMGSHTASGQISLF